MWGHLALQAALTQAVRPAMPDKAALKIMRLILVSVQDESKYGMLLRVSNDWGKSWRDRDCWTCDW